MRLTEQNTIFFPTAVKTEILKIGFDFTEISRLKRPKCNVLCLCYETDVPTAFGLNPGPIKLMRKI